MYFTTIKIKNKRVQEECPSQKCLDMLAGAAVSGVRELFPAPPAPQPGSHPAGGAPKSTDKDEPSCLRGRAGGRAQMSGALIARR